MQLRTCKDIHDNIISKVGAGLPVLFYLHLLTEYEFFLEMARMCPSKMQQRTCRDFHGIITPEVATGLPVLNYLNFMVTAEL